MGTYPKEYQYAYPIILSLKNESYMALKIVAQGLAAFQKCNQALALTRTLTVNEAGMCVGWVACC